MIISFFDYNPSASNIFIKITTPKCLKAKLLIPLIQKAQFNNLFSFYKNIKYSRSLNIGK
ncbi:conserved hypothetical protein (plasmid) [Borreliella burgdorferi WI91-23]|nr:conserved hypothetical protein [Borreliella burgdorferi 64b]ACN55552.1 conserved hypothetical protein [Borreliella burgdorferi WI91-23]